MSDSDSGPDGAGGSGPRRHDPKECLRMQPRKSILKTQTSMEAGRPQEKRPSVAGAHFDEMNIVLTHHPADKDYGHMKIDEPKTPYHHYEDSVEEQQSDGGAGGGTERGVRRVSLSCHDAAGDANLAGEVATRIASGSAAPRPPDEEEGDGPDETEEERSHRVEFERKRRQHYNEGQKMREAKALVDKELHDIEQMEQEEERVRKLSAGPAAAAAAGDMHTA